MITIRYCPKDGASCPRELYHVAIGRQGLTYFHNALSALVYAYRLADCTGSRIAIKERDEH